MNARISGSVTSKSEAATKATPVGLSRGARIINIQNNGHIESTIINSELQI